MSYDLFVFDPASAPADNAQVLDWYKRVTKEGAVWSNDPVSASDVLAAFYTDLKAKFPPMNGPDADLDDESPRVTGYGFLDGAVYLDFRWDVVEEAYQETLEAAERTGCGVVTISDDSTIFRPFPAADGFELRMFRTT